MIIIFFLLDKHRLGAKSSRHFLTKAGGFPPRCPPRAGGTCTEAFPQISPAPRSPPSLSQTPSVPTPFNKPQTSLIPQKKNPPSKPDSNFPPCLGFFSPSVSPTAFFNFFCNTPKTPTRRPNPQPIPSPPGAIFNGFPLKQPQIFVPASNSPAARLGPAGNEVIAGGPGGGPGGGTSIFLIGKSPFKLLNLQLGS